MDFNSAPYNNDFDKTKNHYKVLFKPDFEVQARELNITQSILQNQIASIGNHLFKNGAKITGCSTSFVQYDYIRLVGDELLSPYNSTKNKVVGAVSKVEARIVSVSEKTKLDPATIHVIYTKTGIDNEQSVFINGEDVEIYDENDVLVKTLTVTCPGCGSQTASSNSQTTSSNSQGTTLPSNVIVNDDGTTTVLVDTVNPTGKSLFFNIEEGTFYYNGYFVNVDSHKIEIEKYLTKDSSGLISSDRSYRVGLNVIETVVTVEQDESLYDNHLGYPNYTAPGADRYKIELTLGIKDYVQTNDDVSFIVLAKVRSNHSPEYMKSDTEYAELMKEIARRTYETSGDFTYVPWKAYFLNERKKSVDDSKGWSLSGSDSNFVAVLNPGTGYIKGSRVNTIADTAVIGRKARDTKKIRGAGRSFTPHASLLVSTDQPLTWISHTGQSTLSDKTINVLDSTGTSIGSFKALDIYRESETTYRIYLYDLVLVNGKTLSLAKSVKITDGTLDATIVSNTIDDVSNNTLLFNLGYSSVKSIRDNDNNNNGNTQLEVRRRLSGVLDGNGNITFTSSTNEQFISPTISNPICWVTGNTMITITTTNVEFGQYSLMLKLGSTHAGKSVTYITSVKKTAQKENTKTLTRHSYTTSARPESGINTVLTLPHVDGYKLESVKRVSISNLTISDDITADYKFNNGQTDVFYTPATLTRTNIRDFENDDRLIITYYYFEHSGSNGFFTVDSYSQLVNDEQLDLEYSDIPSYTNKAGQTYRLAECIDFRTVKTSDGKVNTQSMMPTFNSSYTFDVEYYLPRADLLLVNSTGDFYFKEGIPSEQAVLPEKDENSMPIYEVHIDAYTYTVSDIKTKYFDNKRYSMKDIANLDSRIKNLEYSVSLNMLEQQTLNMSIKDQNGLDRYKNGFIVDNFKGYYAADINNGEFKAALDRAKGYLRPSIKQDNVKLNYVKDQSTNLVEKGNVLITRYEHDMFITNPYSTSTLSINPYMVFRRVGSLVLSPNIDTWADTETLPNVVTSVDAGVEALRGVASAAGLLGTDYGSWIDYNTTVIGQESTSTSSSNVMRYATVTNVATTTTTTTQTDSFRTATTTSIGSESTSYTIDDIVKDVSIIPYVRSKTIQFYGSNLKPNTRVYAYFDGIDVTKYCRQVKSGSPLLPFGEDPMITDSTGNIIGEFEIPGNTFFSGEKTFVLTNDVNNSGDTDVETTRAEGVYFSSGISQSKQSSTLNVITPTYNVNTSVENKSSTSVSRTTNVTTTTVTAPPVVSDGHSNPNLPPIPDYTPPGNWDWNHFRWIWSGGRWIWDPIAQGFKVEDSCFISKVGVYFSSIGDVNDVVWFEIREMVNGYPSSTHIAHKDVKTSDLSQYVTDDASKEYIVEFDTPVYVDKSKTYCFVIGGFSPETRVHISTLGEKLTGSVDQFLEQPPLPYTMFRSLNGETWTAYQYDTMKLNMYRCVFDMSGSTLAFEATSTDDLYLEKDPIEVLVDSEFIHVTAKDHGLRVGDSVNLQFNKDIFYELITTSGVPTTGQTLVSGEFSGTIKSVRKNNAGNYEVSFKKSTGTIVLDAEYTCESIEYNYNDIFAARSVGTTIDTVVIPDAVGSILSIVNDTGITDIGGESLSKFAKNHIVKGVTDLDGFIIEIKDTTFTSSGRFGGYNVVLTGVNKKYDMFNISGSHLSYDAAEKWTLVSEKMTGGLSRAKSFNLGEDTYLDEGCVILSEINEKVESFDVKADIKLRSPYVSPVFNADSFSIITVSNRIEMIDQSTYDSGFTRFVPETHPTDGSEKYKYIQNRVNLENPASDLRIVFDVLCQAGSDFDVYVKVTDVTGVDDELTTNWMILDKYSKRPSDGNTVEYDLELSKHCTAWTSGREYKAFRVKLVGRSNSTSRPVIFENYRAIAIT